MATTTITKRNLSGSTNGRGIKVAATATPGTTLHTADPTAQDEVNVYFTNTDSVDRAVTVEFGGTTAPDDNMKFIIPAGETVLGIPGIPLTNSLVVKAFAAAANVIIAFGFVNRIVQN
jgi:hypothetical protein